MLKVITNITGATTDFGFKGINGNFNRTNLLFFNQEIPSEIKFTRLDSGESVMVDYNPQDIKANPRQPQLFQKIMQGLATGDEVKGGLESCGKKLGLRRFFRQC